MAEDPFSITESSRMDFPRHLLNYLANYNFNKRNAKYDDEIFTRLPKPDFSVPFPREPRTAWLFELLLSYPAYAPAILDRHFWSIIEALGNCAERAETLTINYHFGEIVLSYSSLCLASLSERDREQLLDSMTSDGQSMLKSELEKAETTWYLMVKLQKHELSHIPPQLTFGDQTYLTYPFYECIFLAPQTAEVSKITEDSHGLWLALLYDRLEGEQLREK